MQVNCKILERVIWCKEEQSKLWWVCNRPLGWIKGSLCEQRGQCQSFILMLLLFPGNTHAVRAKVQQQRHNTTQTYAGDNTRSVYQLMKLRTLLWPLFLWQITYVSHLWKTITALLKYLLASRSYFADPLLVWFPKERGHTRFCNPVTANDSVGEYSITLRTNQNVLWVCVIWNTDAVLWKVCEIG